MLTTAGARIGELAIAGAGVFLPWRVAERVSGAGCSSRIPEILKKENVKKVMVVTGRHVGNSLAAAIIENVIANGIEAVCYDRVEPNPTNVMAEEIRDMYLGENCDGFLAVGGGSPIDAAKCAAAMISRPQKKPGQLRGLIKVLVKVPPFIAVPTTAGTGSETTLASVITDAETRHKYAIMDPVLIPKVAVLDPELTRELPPDITATTGMDALTHALEAYLCWTNTTKRSNAWAKEATVLIFRYLEKAYADGGDMQAREMMQDAAFKAGWAFGRAGVGNVHAIAHTLGGLYNTPHGLANAVILPIVLEDYGKAAYGKLAEMAELTGVMTEGTKEEKAKAFIAEIYDMNKRMGIPAGFDFIKDEDIPQMVEWAKSEANPTYPVPVVYDSERFTKVIGIIREKAK